jgi:hypothetical protein
VAKPVAARPVAKLLAVKAVRLLAKLLAARDAAARLLLSLLVQRAAHVRRQLRPQASASLECHVS